MSAAPTSKPDAPLLQGVAQEPIPYGALVLCRGNRVTVAGSEVANGTARARPGRWADRDKARYRKGEHLLVTPIAGLGGRDLHAIANGPIMDSNALYLPAGRLTVEEYHDRVAADVLDLSDRAPIAEAAGG